MEIIYDESQNMNQKQTFNVDNHIKRSRQQKLKNINRLLQDLTSNLNRSIQQEKREKQNNLERNDQLFNEGYQKVNQMVSEMKRHGFQNNHLSLRQNKSGSLLNTNLQSKKQTITYNSQLGNYNTQKQEQNQKKYESQQDNFSNKSGDLNDIEVQVPKKRNRYDPLMNSNDGNISQQIVAQKQKTVRNNKMLITGTMDILQKSLDIQSTRDSNYTLQNKNQSLASRNVAASQMSHNLPDAFSRFGRIGFQKSSVAASGQNFSKDYYMKYIHNDNKKRLRASQQFVNNFIPQKETEKKTFKQRFKYYMKQVDLEHSQYKAQEMQEEIQKRLKFIEKKKQLEHYISSLKSNDAIITKKSSVYGKSLTASNSNSKFEDEEQRAQHNLMQQNIYINQQNSASFKIVTEEEQILQQSSMKKSQINKLIKSPNNRLNEDSLVIQENEKPKAQDKNLTAKEIMQKTVVKKIKGKNLTSILKDSIQESDMGLIQNTQVSDKQDKILSSSFQGSKKKTEKQVQKNLDEVIQEKMKIIKQKLENVKGKAQFQNIANDFYRLSKQKFKQFIAFRYGNIFSEKLQSILDINGSIDFPTFCLQISQIIQQRNLLLHIAFDIFDANGDDKISEMDLFKVFYTFNKGPLAEEFENIFYQDICQMTDQLKKLWDIKYRQILKDNNYDSTYAQRFLYWRNQQLMDPNYDKKKQKVLWPIFEFKKHSPSNISPEEIERKKKKIGFNQELFMNIESVKMKNSVSPIYMKNQKQIEFNKKDKEETDSDDEYQQKDFFESSVFWKHENQKRQATMVAKDSQINRENRKSNKTHNSIQNNFMMQRKNRKLPELNKLKPQMGGKYTTGQNNKYIFDNPIFEYFISTYVENTQEQQNDYITFEQFKTIVWKNGMPQFIIDLLQYITSFNDEIADMFHSAKKFYQKVSIDELQNIAYNLKSSQDYGDSQILQRRQIVADQYLEEIKLKNNSIEKVDQEKIDAQLAVLSKEIKDYKNKVGHQKFDHAFKVFKELVANPDKNKIESKIPSQYYCTEKSITDNFEKLFGFKNDVFAKILYINMSKQKNHAKIDFMRFINVFDGLYDEVQKRRNRCIFDLYDVKKQGNLDIMLLMQIFNNIDRNTLFAQEILVLVREYKQKNVLLCEGFTRKITLNFQTFNDLVPNSCFIDELQYIIFGQYFPPKKINDAKQLGKLIGKELQNIFENNISKISIQNTGKKSTKKKNQPNDQEKIPSRGIIYIEIQNQLKDLSWEDMIKKMDIPETMPPLNSPFEVIPNLNQIKIQEMSEKGINVEEYITPADYMMSNDQYQKIFNSYNIKDCNMIINKFK